MLAWESPYLLREVSVSFLAVLAAFFLLLCTHCTALSCNVLICAVLVCSRLQEMEQTCEMDMEAMRQECSRRVSDVERRLQVAVREKDALKVSLHDAEMEVSRRLVV